MNFLSAIFFIFVVTNVVSSDCPTKKTQSKLICYYSKLTQVDSCKCSHVILPADSDVKSIDRFREHAKGVKILITVNEFNQGLVNILKSSKVDGIEINLKKLDSKNDINDFISTVRSKLGADLKIVLSVPTKAETLAKYYDFKALSKNADLFILQTAFLGASKNVTFHPSRLSGLWDMQNTDSVVDLVSGLGAPLSKLVITAPVQAFKFKLQDEKHTAPGSPALEVQSITRDELCTVMGNGGNWTLERDQDQSGPYIFSKDQWIAFDDATSIDIKAKYARVRGLAGMALKDLSQDGGTKCESSILDAAFNGLSRQARAPRGAVLHSLEREILETPVRPLDTIQVSPYRISRVIDVEGNVHVIRKDTRTEFECSRQGYFVHPHSCGRFYRCVKFDQLSDEFSVFEFDCPAGLAFDSRVEVCVWPGSLPHASACSGSSEIAPVPRERFVCPNEPGYYADPENCRWFFACLDHGKSPLSAYEFRCPFGLVYDESRLLCEWPWLVPKCGSGYAVGSEVVYGGSGSVTLDQYDGLGVLGATALGGLHGPLQQPVVYSNIGLGGQSYVEGAGQLSVNAAQSLQNAGLLKTGYVSTGNLAYSTTGNVGVNGGNVHGSSLIYTQVQDSAYGGVGYNVKSQGFIGVNSELNHIHNSGAYLVNTGLYQGHVASDQTNYVQYGNNLNYQTGLSGAAVKSGYEGSLHLVDGGASLVAGTGAVKAGYVGTTNAHLVNGLAENYQQGILLNQQNENILSNGVYAQGAAVSGYDSAKSSVEYHGNTGTTYGSGTSGSINIVGGGYSAVGVASDGVQVSNYGDTVSVTQSPIAVSTASSIPTVTSVPVPALNVASGFESYNGGVVANVPELQYKVQSRGNSGFANISSSFVNVVSSTPSTVIAQHGYQYPKPTVSFVEEPSFKTVSTGTSFVQQNVAHVQPVVTTYQKPLIVSTTHTPVVVEKVQPIIPVVQPVVTTYQKPVIVSTTQAPVVVEKVNLQPVVTTYQKPVTTSFVQQHVQPVVTTYHKPIVVSSTPAPVVVQKVNIQPVVSTYNVAKQDTAFVGYDYPKPAVKFEEVPVKTTGGSFSYQNIDLVHKTEGYAYPKPAVAFEEVPVKTFKQEAVSTFAYSTPSTVKPVTFVQKVQPVVQPQIHVTSYNVPSTTVKPFIVEQPQVYVSSTPAPIQPIVKQEAVSFLNFQKHETVQPQLEVSSYNLPSSTIKPIVTQVVQQKVVQPAIVSSFSLSSNSEGYHYEKPKIRFEEKPAVVTYQQPIVQQKVVQPTVVTYQQPIVQQKVVQPTVVTYQQPIVQQKVVQPSFVTYQQPAVQQKVVQPAVVSSFSISSNSEGYHYEKPKIRFEEKPAVVTYQQPAIQKTFVSSQPVYSTYNYKTPVSTYNYKNVVQSVVNQGYSYPKPVIGFEETPASFTKLSYSQPAAFSSYSYTAPSTVRPAVVVQKQAPVVTSYTYNAPSTVKPAVFVQQPTYVSSTPKPVITYSQTPVVIKKQPAVVSSYSFTNNVQSSGYDYPKPVAPFVEEPAPVVTSYENRQPVEEVPFIKKKAYVTGGGYQYTQQFNKVAVEQKPLVVENYQAAVQPVVVSTTPQYEYKQPVIVSTTPQYEYKQPVVVSTTPQYKYRQPVVVSTTPNYEYKQPIVSTPQYKYRQPVVQEKVVVSTTPRYEYKQQQYSVDSGYVYNKPSIRFEEQPAFVETYQAPIQKSYYTPKVVSSTPKAIVDQSTPKPTFASAVSEIISAKQPFTFYDSRIHSTPKPAVYSTSLPVVETVSTSRPVSKFAFGSVDDQYEYTKTFVSPEVTAKIDVTPVVTTSRPIAKYEFSSFDTKYQQPKIVESYVAPVEVTTLARDYLPVKVTTNVPYVVPEVTTSVPVVKVATSLRPRVRVTTIAPEIVTPTREYLPVRSRVKVTTPASTYLPVEEEIVSTRRPVKIVKVARPKTIVKVNDFHPLLPAKLGAQCTCVSNSVKLRKKKLRIVVEEDDDDDGYVVDNDGNNDDVVVENYQYEPQKLVEITPTPEIYIKSTTSRIVEPTPSPTYSVKKRVRVRPATSTILYESPVTEAAEIFVKKTVTPAVAVNAVAGDVKLSKTSLESRGFDRYGPGGWRSRNEKLQGTIDCQRAGLFRHPTQCNKFYACRWDCTKNRYTLHVFNCPVHLTFDNNLGACNWPSQGPACLENTLLPSD